MKKFAGTWVALAIFGALLAWLLIAKPKGVEERREASLTLTRGKRETIDRIEIRNPHGRFILRRVSAGSAATASTPTPAPVASGTPVVPEVWTLTRAEGGSTGSAAPSYSVEDSALNQMKNALTDLNAVDPVWGDPTDAQRAQVDLKDAPTSVTWHTPEGDRALKIGKLFPKRDELYVEGPESHGIFLARKYSVDVFQKGLDDLRRRKIYEFDRDAVLSISVETKAGGKLVAVRADALAPWKTTAPFVGRADRGKLNNLIAKIAALRAEEFVAADPKQGFAEPRATITLATSDGASHTLVVGADGAPGKWFAKDPASGETFVVSAQIPADLKDPFPAWRDKALFDFPPEEVWSVELSLNGAIHTWHRDDSRMFVADDGGRNVNAEVSQFLRAVKGANVSERVESPRGAAPWGFDNPVLSASWMAGAKDAPQKFEVVVGAAKGSARWVKTGESPAALLVAADLASAARALADASKPMTTGTAGSAAAASHPSRGI